MGMEVVTMEDLEKFRQDLLRDIEDILAAKKTKMWLKTQDVTEMLDVSEVTLHTLRSKGIIPYRKLGGICYYHIDELNEAIKKLKP